MSVLAAARTFATSTLTMGTAVTTSGANYAQVIEAHSEDLLIRTRNDYKAARENDQEYADQSGLILQAKRLSSLNQELKDPAVKKIYDDLVAARAQKPKVTSIAA